MPFIAHTNVAGIDRQDHGENRKNSCSQWQTVGGVRVDQNARQVVAVLVYAGVSRGRDPVSSIPLACLHHNLAVLVASKFNYVDQHTLFVCTPSPSIR